MSLENKIERIRKRFEKEDYKINSLIASAVHILKRSGNKGKVISGASIEIEQLEKLHTISCLYLYTNPPPVGYGTPGPKVAESVLRAYSYNKKKEENRKVRIKDYNIENSKWLKADGIFPYEGVSSNWSPYHARGMAVKFLQENSAYIIQCAKETMEYASMTNSDILTKGRQTWCVLFQKSVPSAIAHHRYLRFIKDNIGTEVHTLIELIQAIFKLMEVPNLRCTKIKKIIKMKKKYIPALRQRINKTIAKKIIVRYTTKNKEESFKVIMDHIRSFCSYIKEGERGKKDRRAIASPSIPMRAILLIVEDFHLKLGKYIPGSTISIGGEEKKQKIERELSAVTLPTQNVLAAQGTEDATKWNETLSPALFALVHHTWFDSGLRKELSIPVATEDEKLFAAICSATFSIMAIKRITLGPGLNGENETTISKIEWKAENISKMNEKTKEWFSQAIPYLEEDSYLLASGGFLMGMLNAASTTIGLLATGYALDERVQRVVTLRSSDDSMSVYVGDSIKNVIQAVDINKNSLKLLGINMSTSKSIIFREKMGEYTSWYQDGTFVAQYGQDTSALRPTAQNPQDDFNSVAKLTYTAMMSFGCNIVGATARVKIGLSNVRRLYRIQYNPEKRIRSGISANILFLADGGKCPWGISNLALDESTIRYPKAESIEDKNYFYKIMSPNNPMAGETQEEIMYSRDSNRLVLIEPETPRNVFCFIRKSNRTTNDPESKARAEREKACSQIFKTVISADPSLLLKIPSSRVSLSNHVAACLRILASTIEEEDEGLTRLLDRTCAHLTTLEEIEDPFDIVGDEDDSD